MPSDLDHNAAESCSSGDDFWGADSDDGNAQRDLERERTARGNQFWNAGYRDGVDAGKEKTLQHGFDIGFKEGALAGFEWGALRAAVKTLEILCGQVDGTAHWHDQVAEMTALVDSIQPRLAMLGAFKQILQRPMDSSLLQDRNSKAAGSSDAEELSEAFARLNASHEDGSNAQIQLPGAPASGPPLELPDMAATCAAVRADLSRMGMDVMSVHAGGQPAV